MRTLILVILFSCTYAATDWPDDLIHPLALEEATCWLSDTHDLEYSEIVITAVRANRNKYQYDRLVQNGERIDYDTDRMSLSISRTIEGNLQTYELVSNYGGSDSFGRRFTGVVSSRQIEIGGEVQSVLVFTVTSIANF